MLMATTNNKKPTGRRAKSLSLLLAVVIAVAIALGIFSYNKYSDAQDKQKFEQARTAIDSVYADIVAQVGPPDDRQSTNACNIHKEEFASPSYTCYVETNFIYGLTNEDRANRQLKIIRASIARSKIFDKKQIMEKALKDRKEVVGIKSRTTHIALDRYQYNRLACTTYYEYDPPDEIDLKITDSSKIPFEVSINCDGPAKNLYYPLRD